MSRKIIIGTRKSRLSLAQANIVLKKLQTHYPEQKFEIYPIITTGDKLTTSRQIRTAGKGVFVKELERALLKKRIDLAVHSLKDMTTTLPDGLTLCSVLEREDPSDCFLSRDYLSIERLPRDAVIATGSLRRRAFLRAAFGYITIEEIKGNLDTRIHKLYEDKKLNGIVVSLAGLKRLFNNKIPYRYQVIPLSILPPAPGQGALGIEIREDREKIKELVAPLNHEPTFLAIKAERAILLKLEGGCNVPIAAYAELQLGLLKLICWVATIDGSRVIKEEAIGSPDDIESICNAVEIMLKNRDVQQIIADIRSYLPRQKALSKKR